MRKKSISKRFNDLEILKDNFVLYTNLFIFNLIMIIFARLIILESGHIIYPLDDAYIHMAIAKNFSKYGVWGINKEYFTSSSSSLLYTVILSFSY